MVSPALTSRRRSRLVGREGTHGRRDRCRVVDRHLEAVQPVGEELRGAAPSSRDDRNRLRHRLQRHETERLVPSREEQQRVGRRRTPPRGRPASTKPSNRAGPRRRVPAPSRRSSSRCRPSPVPTMRSVTSSGSSASACTAMSNPLRGSSRPTMSSRPRHGRSARAARWEVGRVGAERNDRRVC